MPTISKRGYWAAVFTGRCPHCREGKIFKHDSLLPGRFSVLNEYCPNCGVQFEQEPGFFFGAMYVQYAFSVAIVVTVGLGLYHLFGNPEMWVYLTAIITINLLTVPITFRLSKVLYLFLFGPISYAGKSD